MSSTRSKQVARPDRVAGACLAFIAGLTLVGCAEPSASMRAIAAIVGGAPTEQGAAVRLHGAGNCMGTLIAPNVVLAAKHCVVGFEGGGPFECDEHGELVVDPDAEVVWVGAGEFVDEPLPAETFSVGLSAYAPRGEAIFVSEGETICASDTALVVLDEPVDDPRLAPLRLGEPPAIGEVLTAVGHGQHEAGEQSAELLGVVEVTVTAIGPMPKAPGVADAVWPGAFTTTAGPCRGDSGSAAFAESGAAVGVASSVGRPDLDEPTGTADDCIGSRATYEATATQAELIEQALAYAGAAPWLEGDPDPRADLAGFEEACAADDDCASNACVANAEGELRCSHGCEAGVCPEGYGCEVVDDRLRCVAAPPAALPPPEEPAGGCAVSGSASRSPGAWALMVMASVLARRRSSRRSGTTGPKFEAAY